MNLDVILGLYITISAVVVFFIILLDNRNAHQTYAWLIVIIFVPIAGLVLYLLFGRNWRKNNPYRKARTKELFAQTSKLLAPVIEMERDNIQQLAEELKRDGLGKLPRIAYSAPYMMPISATDIRLYTNGEEKYQDLVKDIHSAQTFVHMEYYIYTSDHVTGQIFDALEESAKRGVEVRVFFDMLGSLGFKYKDKKRLRQAGAKVYSGKSPLDKINYRSHRKLVVIDANVSYIGGMNMSEHYATGGKFEEWRDTHLRVEGNVAAAIQELFAKYWFHATKEDLNDDKYLPKTDPPEYDKAIMVQLIHSGADTEWETVRQLYDEMIASAKKSIILETPYFIPPETINSALINAALGEVNVKVILAGISDNLMSRNASFTHFKELLTAGVEIYLFEKGFMHGKSMSIDSKYCTVGSANLDPRSMSINYEANLIIYNEEFTKRLEQAFAKDLKKCRQVTIEEIENASFFERLKWSLFRLLSPLL
jgi:cardiolipin synthase